MPRTFIILILSVAMLIANPATAQDELSDTERLNSKISELEQQITEMKKKYDEQINVLRQQMDDLAAQAGKRRTKDELVALRELAKARAAEEVSTEEEPEETTFRSGALGLQALNPEISVTGDFLFSSRQDTTSDESSDFDLRTLGIHLESWLDPSTRFKAAIPVTESGSELGEGYMTLYNVADDLNLPDELVDVVFFLDSYHLLFHSKNLLAKIYQNLAPTGRVYVLDRKANTSLSRRETSHRRKIPPETVEQEMTEAGFSLWFRGPRLARDRFLLVFGKKP